MIDRFGPLPEEVEHLFRIVAIKHLCRIASVEKIEAGPKGATISFRTTPIPTRRAGASHHRTCRHHEGAPRSEGRGDADWPTPESRLKGPKALLNQLARLAKAA
jgi:transcription-repair coupling factor (superfamily II helicase)